VLKAILRRLSIQSHIEEQTNNVNYVVVVIVVVVTSSSTLIETDKPLLQQQK